MPKILSDTQIRILRRLLSRYADEDVWVTVGQHPAPALAEGVLPQGQTPAPDMKEALALLQGAPTTPSMHAGEYRFSYQGETLCVVVAGDVLALPEERWSMGGFGRSISVEWLLYEARLPGAAARKKVLAKCLVQALDTHHAGAPARGDGEREPKGPSVPCEKCNGFGFTPKEK